MSLNKSNQKPVCHDFRSRYWGNDFVIKKIIDDGQVLEIMGWNKNPIKKGDYIMFANGFARVATYRVDVFRHYFDPKGMFAATLKYDNSRFVCDNGQIREKHKR